MDEEGRAQFAPRPPVAASNPLESKRFLPGQNGRDDPAGTSGANPAVQDANLMPAPTPAPAQSDEVPPSEAMGDISSSTEPDDNIPAGPRTAAPPKTVGVKVEREDMDSEGALRCLDAAAQVHPRTPATAFTILIDEALDAKAMNIDIG